MTCPVSKRFHAMFQFDFTGEVQCGYPTVGETETMAAYAETAIPLLAGKPGFDFLELNASARWTGGQY